MTKLLDRTHGYYDESSETRHRSERSKFHDYQVVEIVRHAYKDCPAFHERFKRANQTLEEIKGVADLVRIPVFHKDDLINLQEKNPPFGGLLGVPEHEVSWIFMSPGPIYDPVLANNEARERAMACVLYSCGFRKGDKVLNTWSYHMVPAGIGIDLALRYLGCTVIPTGTGNTELQVEILQRLKVNGFVGTAGFLMNILKKAEEMRLNLRKDLNLQVAMAGGEPGGGPIRELFEKEYGMTTGDFYGTADVGPIAYECKEKTGMHLVDNIIAEIVDPKTGEVLPPGKVGEVVITNFNKAYPLIRFGTGDLSSLDLADCPCGRTSIRITKILGRIGDALRVRGMFIHLKQIKQVMESFPEINAFQIVVNRPGYRDNLILRVELKDVSVNKEDLQRSLSEKFREICRLLPDEIIFSEPGKLPGEKKIFVDERKY